MRLLPWLACLGLLTLGGCMELNMGKMFVKAKKLDLDLENSDKPKETELVGAYATIAGNNVIAVHGVGLVTGLNNTGEDPAPSVYRTQLENDMKKYNIGNYRELLQSPSTALVLLTAYLPTDILKGGTFDVEVRLPPNTEATSLEGGWLLPTDLTEQANVQGQGTLKGKVFGRCAGPILVSIGKGENEDGVRKRGRILGGGVAMKERTLGLYLRSDFRSVRNTSRIANKIGARFHFYDHGQKKSLATAKDDQYIELKVHPRYKDNYPRYMQVIRHVAFRENDIQRRDRMETLLDELTTPDTSAKAAIQYESIGVESCTFLRKGLAHESPEVRFYSAEALAYLGEESGAEELAKLAKTEPAFRVYCFAALAALNEASCYQLLRDLMNEKSAETKYGAFRALWTLDREDPFIRGTKLNEHFWLHVVDTTGEPMIHLTRHRRPEIVLFGAQQHFRTPLALTAGNHINVNAQAGTDTISITRFELGKDDQKRVVSTRVADVIRAAAEMGATYPDIAQLINQADVQFNLEGRLEFDSLPQAGRLYYRTVSDEDTGGKEKKKSTQVGRLSLNPNLFPTLSAPGEAPEQNEEIEVPLPMGSGNLDEEDEETSDSAALKKTSPAKSAAKLEAKTKPADDEMPPIEEGSNEDVPPQQSKSKSKSWLNFFGVGNSQKKEKASGNTEESIPEPDDTEELSAPPQSAGKDLEEAEALPPPQPGKSGGGFQIE